MPVFARNLARILANIINTEKQLIIVIFDYCISFSSFCPSCREPIQIFHALHPDFGEQITILRSIQHFTNIVGQAENIVAEMVELLRGVNNAFDIQPADPQQDELQPADQYENQNENENENENNHADNAHNNLNNALLANQNGNLNVDGQLDDQNENIGVADANANNNNPNNLHQQRLARRRRRFRHMMYDLVMRHRRRAA